MYRIPKMILTEGASGQRVDSKREGFQLGLHAPKKKDRGAWEDSTCKSRNT